MLAGILLFLGTFAVFAQRTDNNSGLPTIRIVNNTGYDIFSIYISPSEDDLWGDDLLGDDILEDGQTFTYQLPFPLSTYSVYDVAIVDEDDDSYTKMEVTMTDNARIVFTFDDID